MRVFPGMLIAAGERRTLGIVHLSSRTWKALGAGALGGAVIGVILGGAIGILTGTFEYATPIGAVAGVVTGAVYSQFQGASS